MSTDYSSKFFSDHIDIFQSPLKRLVKGIFVNRELLVLFPRELWNHLSFPRET